MSKFTVKKSLVEIELEYVELEKEIFLANSIDEKEREKLKERIKVAKASFERPTWSSFNSYIKGCVEVNPLNGIPYVDTITLRDRKFRKLLKKLVDGDGEEVFLDNDFFNNVIPEFAVALVQMYDEKLEKEKNDILFKDEFIKKIILERISEETNELTKNDLSNIEKTEKKDEK